ncbi:MAG: hypothetical protein LHW50_05715, partial [Candidatus Cloacimonetes bacterium]|nr:hypothetical protein [Candidatus Cloacimonadota bacterium]
MFFRPPNSAHHNPAPELGGTPDSSGRWCQIHLAQCSSHHPTPLTTTQPLSLEEHRIHPVVGARFIWHSVLPTTQLRPLQNPAPELGGTPDSSGRRCQIHLAQCSSDHPTPLTTTQPRSVIPSAARNPAHFQSIIPELSDGIPSPAISPPRHQNPAVSLSQPTTGS